MNQNTFFKIYKSYMANFFIFCFTVRSLTPPQKNKTGPMETTPIRVHCGHLQQMHIHTHTCARAHTQQIANHQPDSNISNADSCL